MVKTKSSFSFKLNQIIKSNNDFTTDGQKLYCIVCDKNINVTEKHLKNRVDDHFNSDIHKKNKSLKSQKGDHLSQSLIRNAFNKSQEKEKAENIFNNELTLALVDSNIPLYKLNNPTFKSFLEKYTKRSIPSESVLRQKHVKPFYENMIENIRTIVGSNPVYFIMDETTNKCERKVLNILVGVLNGEPIKPMLLDVKFLEKTDSSHVQQALIDSCVILWPEKIQYNLVWLLVTDQASYMVLAGKLLKNFFPNMKHITCIVHALNRVCSSIQKNFIHINRLISNMKKVLLNSKSKQALL
jgi:hypothetical protein